MILVSQQRLHSPQSPTFRSRRDAHVERDRFKRDRYRGRTQGARARRRRVRQPTDTQDGQGAQAVHGQRRQVAPSVDGACAVFFCARDGSTGSRVSRARRACRTDRRLTFRMTKTRSRGGNARRTHRVGRTRREMCARYVDHVSGRRV